MARYPGLTVSFDICGTMSLKTIDPVAIQTMRIPTMNPKSPTRLVRNAFLAASAAASRSNQCPIST